MEIFHMVEILTFYNKGKEVACVITDEKRLYYGDLGPSRSLGPYITDIDDIRGLSRFRFRFKPVNRHTEAKRSWMGGLIVRRIEKTGSKTPITREDYKRIVNL
jgi:hypothetical protein